MMQETIQQIKTRLQQPIASVELERLKQDPRQGVQLAVQQYERRQQKRAHQQAAFQQRLQFEQRYWQAGDLVAGIDEVGRGPLAGPVVAAAVVLNQHFDLWEVHDSKQLSLKKRHALVPQIKAQVLDYAFGVVEADEIDALNIYQAARKAMTLAYQNLTQQPAALLIDAMELDVEMPQTSLIKGDDRSISIGAASILAKDYRDRLMATYAEEYPGYGFEKNAGYGTQEHLAALEQLGVTPLHRNTFAPVKKRLR